MKPDPLLAFIQKVGQTPEWELLKNTVENTPWHREANVAVHTNMAMVHYYSYYASQRSKTSTRLALMALLFHDFGKPAAHTVSAEGVNQYMGHEVISSSLMFDFFTKYEDLWKECLSLGYTTAELKKIAWLIDHHLPYYLRKKAKRIEMKREMQAHFGQEQTFYDVLRCDSAGRISDDHPVKLQNVADWIDDFKAIVIVPEEELQRQRAEKKAAWFAKQGLPLKDHP